MAMKKTILIIFLLQLSLSIHAQQYCDTILVELIKDYRANKLSAALDELKKAEICDYQNKLLPARQAWQDSIFLAIEQQKQAAILAQFAEKKATQKAQTAEKIALQEQEKAVNEQQKAIIEKEKAIKEKIRADSLKEIATQQELLAKREAAISTAGLYAQEADIANSKKDYQEGFDLAISAITLAQQNQFDIPKISYKALGEAIYKGRDLGYKKTIEDPAKNPIIYFHSLEEGKIFVVYSDNKLMMYNIKEGTSIQQQASNSDILNFQVSPNKQFISIQQDNGNNLIWDLTKDTLISIPAHQQAVLGATFSHDSKKLLTWSREQEAKLWSIDGAFLQNFEVGAANKIYQGSFSKADKQILLRSSDWRTLIVNLDNLEQQSIAHDSYATFAAFLPNEQAVVSCSNDKTAKLILADKSVVVLPHENSPVQKAYLSKKAKVFATLDLANTIRVWNSKGKLMATKNNKERIKELVFCTKKELLFYTESNTVYKWNFENEELSSFLEGHLAEVLSIQQNKAGTYFLTHSLDNTAKLWNKNGQLLMTMNQVNSPPPRLSKNGSEVISKPAFNVLEITKNPEKVLLSH